MPSGQPKRTARYEPHEGGWLVSVHRGNDVITAYGRTLSKARQAIVQTLADGVGEYPGHVVLEDAVRLTAPAQKALATARTKKAAALVAMADSQAATAAAAQALVDDGLSLRDCAYLLDLSHARVQQLAKHANEQERR